MKRVFTSVAAAASLAALSFLVLASAPAYADANPDNHGHHYGQLKHPKHLPLASPPPGPAATPTPIAASAPPPATRPATTGASSAKVPSLQPSIGGPTPVAAPQQAANRTFTVRPISTDPLWWLLIVILPALFAVGLIAIRGMLLQFGLRSRPEPQPAVIAASAAELS